MIALTINGVKRHITPISKLSFKAFNRIIVEGKVVDLKEYLALYMDMDLEELMQAEIRAASLPALHQSVFDVDVEATIRSKPKTFTYQNEIYIVDEIRLATFGKNYFFDLYHSQHRAGRINTYELSLYALAVALAKTNNMEEVEKIYRNLSTMNWKLVLPAAFFLCRRFSKGKKNSILSWIIFILELKKTSWLSRSSLKRLKRLERSMLSTY